MPGQVLGAAHPPGMAGGSCNRGTLQRGTLDPMLDFLEVIHQHRREKLLEPSCVTEASNGYCGPQRSFDTWHVAMWQKGRHNSGGPKQATDVVVAFLCHDYTPGETQAPWRAMQHHASGEATRHAVSADSSSSQTLSLQSHNTLSQPELSCHTVGKPPGASTT